MIKQLKKAWLEIGLSVSSSGIEVQENFEIDANTLWEYILKDLKECMPTPSYEMAIKPLGVATFEQGKLTLVTNKTIWAKAIKDKFSNEILRALKKYSRNPEATFQVSVDKYYTSQFIAEVEKPEDTQKTTKATRGGNTQFPAR